MSYLFCDFHCLLSKKKFQKFLEPFSVRKKLQKNWSRVVSSQSSFVLEPWLLAHSNHLGENHLHAVGPIGLVTQHGT